jgi:hypothetical protein
MISDSPLNDAQRGAIAAIREHGFAWLPAAQLRQLLPNVMSDKASWDAFATSWNQLSLDTYMADGGRYRRRRFAAFAVSSNEIVRKPHQPHYQSRDYNPLNGGIERWFDPILDTVAEHPAMQSCLRMCYSLFESVTPTKLRPDSWHVETHQFRIEAKPGQSAQPTPEGLHRDGVDWVLVLLIARENIAEGVTTIFDLNKQPLGSFTLISPLDAAFVDDSRVYHGVTAVQPLDAQKPAYRDVLVVTFRRP